MEWNASKPLSVLTLLFVLVVFQSYKLLQRSSNFPETMPIQFDHHGKVIWLVTRETFVKGTVGVFVFVFFVAIFAVWSVKKNPFRKIKDSEQKTYWLGSGDPKWATTQERKRRRYAVTEIAFHIAVDILATLIFLFYVLWLIEDAVSLAQQQGLDSSKATFNVYALIPAGLLYFSAFIVSHFLLKRKLKVPTEKKQA
jgi:hypothetical protein